MAVSKSLRMEVMRRDNHTCRYCGAAAPDVKLTVDHVMPTTLGGSDEPSNLVTACRDCNAGKSSTPPGAPLVDDVSQDALRWAAAVQRVFDERIEQIEQETAYLDTFEGHWNGFTYSRTGERVPLPTDWQRTITHWYGLDLPLTILLDSVDRAMRKPGLKGYDAEFRYMAGIVWSVLRESQAAAQASLGASAPPKPDVHHCWVQDECAAHGLDPRPCPWCKEFGCNWYCAFSNAAWEGAERERERGLPYVVAHAQYDALSDVCDGNVITSLLGVDTNA